MSKPPRRLLRWTLLTAALVLAPAALAEAPWELRTTTRDGISVFNRNTPGSRVKEVKAEADLDVPAAAAWAVLRDIPAYPKTMPYTKVTVVLGQEKDGAVIYYYTALALPIVADRDYTLKVTVDHVPSDGSGLYRFSWVAAND